MSKIKSLVVVWIALFALGTVAHGQSADDFVDKRSKLMKSISAANKSIKSAVGKKDYKTVAAKARVVANALEMNSFSKHFPQNTAVGKSRAKASIWSNWNDFMSKAQDGHENAMALAAAAEANDGAKVASAYKAYGQTCGGCHKPYRGPAKKK